VEDENNQTIYEAARAKVNLTLHIKGKRPDGYHELESLTVFADFGDDLRFTKAAADSLHVTGPFAAALEGDNLVMRAKKAVAHWLGIEIRGAFRLRKNIPVAAGLGGGSADAAAAIRALFRAYGASEQPSAFSTRAAAIGADVPVCLYQRAAFMRGLGEMVTPLSNVTPLPAILVNPGIKLSTAQVFKTLNAPRYNPALENGNTTHFEGWKSPEEAAALLSKGRNDLEAAAIALEPAVETVLNAILRLDRCLLSRLSGSGPTCFGLFPSREDAAKAAAEIANAQPNWTVVPVTLS